MRKLVAGLVGAGLVGLCGCGGGGYVSVSGVVLLDGEPVPDASVAFQPEDPKGEGATGFTDENGRFTMTSNSSSGVKPGKYKVRIEAIADRPPPSLGMAQMLAQKYEQGSGNANAAGKDAKAAYNQTLKDSAANNKKKKYTTPPIYNDHEKTPLKADVPAQTEYKFELKKDAK